MCSSLLRQSPYLEHFRKRFTDIAPVGVVIVPSGGPGLNSVFHGLSIVQTIMGEGCEWVESMGTNLFDVFRLHYPGTDVIVLDAQGGPERGKTWAFNYSHCSYTASAYGKGGAIPAYGGGAVHTPSA